MPRWWVQYADGAQLDLVLLDAVDRAGHAPGAVVLVDRTGRGAGEFRPTVLRARPGDARRWLMDGWEALSNVAKHVRRGSLLEAVDQLHRARQQVFRLWAVGEGVDHPCFGLTSLMDAGGAATLPPRIEDTHPAIGRVPVSASALALADLLRAAGRHADPQLDTPLADHVIARLSQVASSADRDQAYGSSRP